MNALKLDFHTKIIFVLQVSLEAEKLRRDQSYLQEENEGLKSNVGNNKSSNVHLLNECKALMSQLNNSNQKNTDLGNEAVRLTEELKLIKTNSTKEIKVLQDENLKLKKDINVIICF